MRDPASLLRDLPFVRSKATRSRLTGIDLGSDQVRPSFRDLYVVHALRILPSISSSETHLSVHPFIPAHFSSPVLTDSHLAVTIVHAVLIEWNGRFSALEPIRARAHLKPAISKPPVDKL